MDASPDFVCLDFDFAQVVADAGPEGLTVQAILDETLKEGADAFLMLSEDILLSWFVSVVDTGCV
jgi:hypothetical protein